MQAAEFTEWMLYTQYDPFGNVRGDIQAAQISATMANAWRGKGSPPVNPSRMVLKFRQSDEERAGDLKDKILKANAMAGGVVNNGDDR